MYDTKINILIVAGYQYFPKQAETNNSEYYRDWKKAMTYESLRTKNLQLAEKPLFFENNLNVAVEKKFTK